MRGIALQIRPAGRAIEHVIRRKVHEPGVELAACQRQIAHRQRIHQEGRLWFAFRHVNLVVGRGIEDDLGVPRRQHALHLPVIRDVQLAAVPPDGLVSAPVQLAD